MKITKQTIDVISPHSHARFAPSLSKYFQRSKLYNYVNTLRGSHGSCCIVFSGRQKILINGSCLVNSVIERVKKSSTLTLSIRKCVDLFATYLNPLINTSYQIILKLDPNIQLKGKKQLDPFKTSNIQADLFNKKLDITTHSLPKECQYNTH